MPLFLLFNFLFTQISTLRHFIFHSLLASFSLLPLFSFSDYYSIKITSFFPFCCILNSVLIILPGTVALIYHRLQQFVFIFTSIIKNEDPFLEERNIFSKNRGNRPPVNPLQHRSKSSEVFDRAKACSIILLWFISKACSFYQDFIEIGSGWTKTRKKRNKRT